MNKNSYYNSFGNNTFRPSSSRNQSINKSSRSESRNVSRSPLVFGSFNTHIEIKLKEIANYKIFSGELSLRNVQLLMELAQLYLRSNALNTSEQHLTEALNVHKRLVSEYGPEQLFYLEMTSAKQQHTQSGPIEDLSPIKTPETNMQDKIRQYSTKCDNLSHIILISLAMTNFKNARFEISQRILKRLQPIFETVETSTHDLKFISSNVQCWNYLKTEQFQIMKEELQTLASQITVHELNSLKQNEMTLIVMYLQVKLALSQGDLDRVVDFIKNMLDVCESNPNDDKIYHLFKILLSIGWKNRKHDQKILPLIIPYLTSLYNAPFDDNLPKSYKIWMYEIFIQSSVILVRNGQYADAYEALYRLAESLDNIQQSRSEMVDFIDISEYGSMLLKLGTVCMSINKFEEGIRRFKEAAILYTKHLGKNHPLTKSTIDRIAQLMVHTRTV